MKKWLLLGMLALSMNAWAQTTYYIANAIPYADEDKIAERITRECTRLGESFSTYIVKRGQAYGVDIKRAKGDLSEYPNRIEIHIDSARSYGNLFIGHYKNTYVDVVLFEDGVKVKEAKLARSSIGGVFGMIKSSCSVLNRVNSTLSKDIVRWAMSEGNDVPGIKQMPLEETTATDETPVPPISSK